MDTRFDEMQAACQHFHNEHPEVWEYFVKFTLERIRRGFKHYSSNAIFERIRWELGDVGEDGVEQFKLNNNYRPFYARRFMRVYPQYDGFFRTRVQKSEKMPAICRPELTPQDFDYIEGEFA
jgi:hypothetical protein